MAQRIPVRTRTAWSLVLVTTRSFKNRGGGRDDEDPLKKVLALKLGGGGGGLLGWSRRWRDRHI